MRRLLYTIWYFLGKTTRHGCMRSNYIKLSLFFSIYFWVSINGQTTTNFQESSIIQSITNFLKSLILQITKTFKNNQWELKKSLRQSISVKAFHFSRLLVEEESNVNISIVCFQLWRFIESFQSDGNLQMKLVWNYLEVTSNLILLNDIWPHNIVGLGNWNF